MTTPTPAVQAAEKIYEATSCPGWNEAELPSREEMAAIITSEYAPMVEALEKIATIHLPNSDDGNSYDMDDMIGKVEYAKELARNALLNAKGEPVCGECGGAGGVDSGGVTPWGASIGIPCPSCSPAPKKSK